MRSIASESFSQRQRWANTYPSVTTARGEVENMLFEEWKWEEYAAMQKAEGREEGHRTLRVIATGMRVR